MDSSLTVRPRDSIARTTVGRSNTVRTDLSPSQSVNATRQVAAVAGAESAMREPAIDPQTQSLLDREREERPRRQPRKDEAMQRQRAYGRPAEEPAAADDGLPHADLAV